MKRLARLLLIVATLALAVAVGYWRTPLAQPDAPAEQTETVTPANPLQPGRVTAQIDMANAAASSAAGPQSFAAPEALSQSNSAPAEALPMWTPTQAAERMRELERVEECRALHSTATQQRAMRTRERNEWRWLPAAQVAAERAGVEAALARLSQACSEDDKRSPDATRAASEVQTLRAAAQAGNPRARLRTLMPGSDELTPIQRGELRKVLDDILLSGDPALYLQIPRYQAALYPTQQYILASFDQPRPEAWLLAACDLGLDCRAGSPTVDRHCLNYTAAACAAPDLETALHAISAPWEWRRIQRDRRQLVDRLRRGAVQGVFELKVRGTGGG